MSKDSIRLSEKHGVNPSLMLCFYCHEASGVALLGRLKDDAEAPRQAVFDKEPCAKCKEWMAKGIICISVRDGESGDDPYRTGGWAVVTEDFVRRILRPGELLDGILKKRCCFMPDEAWNAINMPHENVEEKKSDESA